ncbi:putative BRCA1-associated protein [Blattamonas nauphoetae]|uniref:BRCA1-associated protein n=1 Tax=Blattamonas nauphoetae TaxID=2049346 RepID=A0ABQ9YFQ7_9EUKA|nr:putative BRCA1-associated protein [Blattamonas nauphoetae]
MEPVFDPPAVSPGTLLSIAQNVIPDDTSVQTIVYGTTNNSSEEGTMTFLQCSSEANSIAGIKSRLQASRFGGKLICIQNVLFDYPVSMLCQTVEPFIEHIEWMRIVREKNTTTHYMVLLNFDHEVDSEAFFTQFNGVSLSFLYNITCTISFVLFTTCSFFSIPITPFYFSPVPSPNPSSFIQPQRTELTPPIDQTPNPLTCSVCLESLHPTTSHILYLLCGHTFHITCFAQWSKGTCPLCRYTLLPRTQTSSCSQCETRENLWVCLSCGFVGCGASKLHHAEQHFVQSGHPYAMDLETEKVWDYVDEQYVHRMIETESDGKIVCLSKNGAPTSDPQSPTHRTMELEEEFFRRIEKENGRIVVDQLERQRCELEERLQRRRKEFEEIARQEKRKVNNLLNRSRGADNELTSLQLRLAELKSRTSPKSSVSRQQIDPLVTKRNILLATKSSVDAQIKDNQAQISAITKENAALTSSLSVKEKAHQESIGEMELTIQDLISNINLIQSIQTGKDKQKITVAAAQRGKRRKR